jgi:hypothetical protein
MSLQNWQTEFVENLFSDEFSEHAIEPKSHMAIYRNNYFTNLTNTLKTTYPLVMQLVGIDFFQNLAREYIISYPSRSSNAHDYGEYFADFLTEYSHTSSILYLPEVARFEWICHYLCFAECHDALDIEAFKNIQPEQFGNLHLILHPASQLMNCQYPITHIIELCEKKRNDVDVRFDAVPLLIIRRELEIRYDALTKAEFTFLNSLTQQNTINDSLQHAYAVDPNFKLEEKLPEWVKNKTIIAFF